VPQLLEVIRLGLGEKLDAILLTIRPLGSVDLTSSAESERLGLQLKATQFGGTDRKSVV
jgi:hypothetical protein